MTVDAIRMRTAMSAAPGATFQGAPNDVAVRVARSLFLYEGSYGYIVLTEESVLCFRTADQDLP